MIGRRGDSPAFIWTRPSQGYSTMEALRRDTFEDVNGWAVDEFDLAETSGLNLFQAEQKSQTAKKCGSFWWNMVVNFGDDQFFLGGVCQSSSLHLFWDGPKSLPKPKKTEIVPMQLHSYNHIISSHSTVSHLILDAAGVPA